MKIPYVVVCVVLLIQQHGNVVNSKKILALSIFSNKSIRYFMEPLLLALAERGHEITTVSPFPTSTPHSRIRDIVGKSIFEGKDNILEKSNFFRNRVEKKLTNALSPQIQNMIANHFSGYYEMSEVKALLNETFDLVISTYFVNECALGFIHHLKAPFILVHSNIAMSFNNPVRVPHPTSFVPLPYCSFTDEMDFYQRTKNYIIVTYANIMNNYYTVPLMETTYRKHFGDDTPGIHEIAKNVSLMFANSHFSLNFPRPSLPDLIELGGLHCKPASPVLPLELNEFLNESGEDGFILFSLGSALRGSTMPEEMRIVFMNVFRKLKQRVVWKWETEMEDTPANVKLSKWLPQQDILGHPNAKLFITHGGLHSVEEAAYHHGVPIIGVPIFADQDANMARYSDDRFGFALTVEIVGLTEETLLVTINKILNDSRYMENAKRLSKRFRDRPLQPVDEAVYWTEYILRHDGAPHLKSAARDLNFVQYHSIDVFIFLLTLTVSILFSLLKLTSFLIKKLRSYLFTSPGSGRHHLTTSKKNK